MSPLRAVICGAAMVRKPWRIWALTWTLTLAFAIVFVLPVAALLARNLGHSLYAAQMLGNFDLAWIREIVVQTAGAPLVTLPPLLIALALAYVILMTFLNGGALGVFTGSTTFWNGCGRYFSRLARLLPYALICYGLVFAANRGLEKAGKQIWGAGMEERPVAIYGWVRAGVILLLVLLVNMIFDYAKIRVVAADAKSAWRAFFSALRFVWRNFGRTAATYALVSLAGLALTALWWAVSGALPRTAIGWLAVVLVAQQACVFARIGIRLLYLASATELHESSPATAP
ncbi:MAG TPA: hypothetical protein VHA11_09865 [Bryobacteraceae bacterium]|nr:hypothetical protein [Bryobacteraceae bacterium]